jgi:hypothetical protein
VPSIWPETYSYVTTELMRLNVPVACFNLGAPPERVARYPLGRVIERIDAALAVRELMALARRANGLALARLAPARLAPERQPVTVSRSADPPTVVVRAEPTRSAEAAAARP